MTLIGNDGLIPTPTELAAANSTNRAVDFKLTKDNKNQISLEPTIHLDQMKRYLDHLNELRRINNGDDTADSPGYALHLVRIPVSVLPGHRTRSGFGAEITVTANPIIDDELLPATFRDMVINDIEDRLTLPITNVLSRLDAEQIAFVENQIETQDKAFEDAKGMPTNTHINQQEQALIDKQEYMLLETWRLAESSDEGGRRARFSFPTRHIRQVYGKAGINTVVKAAVFLLKSRITQGAKPNNVVHLTDVRSFLGPEISAAYEFLSQPGNQELWDDFCTPYLADRIRARDVKSVYALRAAFYDRPNVSSDEVISKYDIKHWATTSLAWAIIVESALLNEHLKKEIRELYSKKGLGPIDCEHLSFVGPNPMPEARQAFNDYVAQRWPIQVFALDPVSQDQNIADEFSRRRELQLAMAVSVARGTMSGAAASNFARRLETDIRTIALNKTHVAFSHGSDTFGWRFLPRVQSPPAPGTLQALAENLGGGPSLDQDLRDRKLEPGIRECTAMIVMPSFVSYATFETRTNWFGLTNPRKKELTMHDTMKLSRSHQAIHTALPQISDCGLYRPADVSQLNSVVQQLDRRMPLQCMTVQIPYENTMGGFEMFNSGVSDLGPQLDGWYGAPGIRVADCDGCNSCKAAKTEESKDADKQKIQDQKCQCQGTTLFLVGENFSVQDTRVIAGGKCITDIKLLSRSVIEVTIPAGVHILNYRREVGCDPPVDQQFVDVHIATPYGVSGHLLVPVYDPESKMSGACAHEAHGSEGGTLVPPTVIEGG